MATAADLGITEPLHPAHELPPILKKAVAKVKEDMELAKRFRKPYEDRWQTFYDLHRGYERIQTAAASGEPGRDVVEAAKREFGAELFIPYVYGLIETMTPRLLMNNPRLKVKPRSPNLSRERGEAVRLMFEERQTEVDYALQLIPVARRGLKYGLGVAKNFWATDTRTSLTLEPTDLVSTIKQRVTGQPSVSRRTDVIEGPKTEDVEILDFFWDPAAKDIETCRFAIHRTWRDHDYIRAKVESREWLPIDLEAVKGMGSTADRGSLFKQRAEAAGLTGYDTNQGRFHEIWEWHNGEQVVIVLDGVLPVAMGESPVSGEVPFSIFRPTLQEGEFVGIGEIESIVDLQRELNTMRSARLDNTMLLIQKAFIYAEGLVDPDDLVVGPGKGIPVDGGSINDVIRPINFGDLPSATFREEAALKSDFEMATGLSETVAGAEGTGNASETATGIQFVQAAANVRVELKTKLLAHGLVKRDTRQWLELYRERTLLTPISVLIEKDGWFEEIKVTGEDLDLVRAVDPEEDSLAPENGPEKKNNALALYNQMRGNEVINQRTASRWFLNQFDIPNAEEWVLPEQEVLNPQVAQIVGQSMKGTLVGSGIPEEAADEMVMSALDAAMQSTGIGTSENTASTNGASSEEAPVGS